MQKIYGLGETVLDIIFDKEHPVAARPGGSAFNAIITLGRLGCNPTFISETGNDKVGDIVTSFLERNGVSPEFVTRFPQGKTSLALAFLNEKGDAEYEFYKNYPKEDPYAKIPDFCENDILIFGSFFGLNPAIRKYVRSILKKANEKNVIIIYDPNFRSSHLHELAMLMPLIEENFKLSTFVRGSDEDFMYIFGDNDISKIYEKAQKWNDKLIKTQI